MSDNASATPPEEEKELQPLPLEELEPLPVEDLEALPVETGEEGGGEVRIQAFGSSAVRRAEAQTKFHRTPSLTGAGAIRCRIFNSKITVAAMDHMVGQINEWLDNNQIEVKHVSEVIGTVEAKTSEPNIIVTIWY